MSLLARVKADFEALVCNTADFGESFSYTPAGGTAATITGVVIPEESRQEVVDGILKYVDQIHVSSSNDNWNPSFGSCVVWDSRTWDFSRVEHDRNGGFVGAYFESLRKEQIGPIGLTPI